jgi:hypothetical protein
MTGDVVRPFVACYECGAPGSNWCDECFGDFPDEFMGEWVTLDRQDTALKRCEGHQVDQYSGRVTCCDCGGPGCPCDAVPVHPGFVQVAAPVRQVDYSPPTALEWVTMAAIVLVGLALAGVIGNLAVEYLARPGVGFLVDFAESRGWTK